MELPFRIHQLIGQYEAFEIDGLTLYPVRVSEYLEFQIGKPALEVLHQSLPVALMRIPLLSALYQMDLEAAFNGKTPSGLFSRALLMLALSLRLGEGGDIDERLNRFQIVADRENPAKLLCLRFRDNDGAEKTITPVQFTKLRQIIAAQNGVKLESDEANPELVKAERDLAELNAPKLDANVDYAKAFVSALSGTDESEIDDWPILKFTRRIDALNRAMDYIVCGIGGAFGGFGKDGNPVPHPFYPKVKERSGALVSMSDFQSSALRSAASGKST